jgi:hypothetical protein
MKLWPFLIAASKSHDYQFVICPDFLEAAGSLFSIKSRLEIDDKDPIRVRTMIFSDPKLGDIAFAYRTGPIKTGGEFERDPAGRVLLYAAGVVARGTPDDSSQAAIFEALNFFEDQLRQSLTEFLASGQNWIPRPAEGGEFPQGSLDYREPTRPVSRMPDKFLICLVAAVALLFGFLVWIDRRVHTLSAQLAAHSAQVAAHSAQLVAIRKTLEQPETSRAGREPSGGHPRAADPAEQSSGNDQQPDANAPKAEPR